MVPIQWICTEMHSFSFGSIARMRRAGGGRSKVHSSGFRITLRALVALFLYVLFINGATLALSVSVAGPNTWYIVDGDWVVDRAYSDYGSMFDFPVSTLPSSGTGACMFVLYCGGEPAGATGGGAFGGLPVEWQDYLQFQVGVSPTKYVTDLVFSPIGVLEGPQKIVGGSFEVAVVIEPKPGMTWADVPRGGYVTMTMKGARSQGTSGTSMTRRFFAIIARPSAYVDVANGTDDATGTASNPFRDLLAGLGAVRDGEVYVAARLMTNAPA